MPSPALGILLRPLTPASLPGLAIWLEASDLVLAHGAAVASWPSRVGAALPAQATGSKQPLYQVGSVNGRNSVLFDGVDDFLATGAVAALDGATTLTIIAVVRAPTFIASSRILGFSYAAGAGASSSDIAGLFYNTATAPQGYFRTAAAGFNGATGGTIVANTWHLQALTNDGLATGPISYLDGVRAAQSNAASGVPTTHVTTAFGSLASGAANFCNVEFAELVICTATVSQSQMGALYRQYVKPKYGL